MQAQSCNFDFFSRAGQNNSNCYVNIYVIWTSLASVFEKNNNHLFTVAIVLLRCNFSLKEVQNIYLYLFFWQKIDKEFARSSVVAAYRCILKQDIKSFFVA